MLNYECNLLGLKTSRSRIKGGVARPKKMATGINYCQNGRLAKAKVTLLCFGHRLLAIISKVFFFKKRTL